MHAAMLLFAPTATRGTRQTIFLRSLMRFYKAVHTMSAAGSSPNHGVQHSLEKVLRQCFLTVLVLGIHPFAQSPKNLARLIPSLLVVSRKRYSKKWVCTTKNLSAVKTLSLTNASKPQDLKLCFSPQCTVSIFVPRLFSHLQSIVL